MAEMIEIGLGLAKAALWPAIAAFVALVVFRFAVPPRRVPAGAMSLVFAAAYCLGHALAAGPDFTLLPGRNWQWLFYLAPLAGVVGWGLSWPRVNCIARCVFVGGVILVAAFLLTAKPTLWAPRPALVIMLVAYLAAVSAALAPLLRVSLRLACLPRTALLWRQLERSSPNTQASPMDKF